MNKHRREALSEAQDRIEELVETLEMLRDEEQDAFDALPEGLQESERGEKMQSAVDSLESAVSDLQSAIEYINQASE